MKHAIPIYVTRLYDAGHSVPRTFLSLTQDSVARFIESHACSRSVSHRLI